MNTIKYFSGILFALVLMMLPQVSFATEDAGVPAKIWTYPVVYALDQEVTWYFDMTGTNFSEGQDLYLWAWSPSEPDAGNFDNSSEFAKLEYVGDIKTFKESGNAVQIYPEKFYIDQPLSLLVNANLVWTGAVQGGLAGEEIHLHCGLNNFAEGAIVEYQAWIPEVSAKTKLTPIGDNIYKIDFIPREYFGVDEDFVMENIEFLFPAKDWAKVGTAEGGKNFVVLAPGVVAPPDPVFYFFPQKFTQYDILTLVRKNNEKKSQGLIYTIVAGGKTITGEFTGKAEEMRAYVNLLQGLAGATNLDKINLEVKDKNGSEILKTDIPLVPLSDLE